MRRYQLLASLVVLLTLSAPARAVEGDFMPEREEVRRQYESLYAERVTVAPDGTKHFGAASAIKKVRVLILIVKTSITTSQTH